MPESPIQQQPLFRGILARMRRIVRSWRRRSRERGYLANSDHRIRTELGAQRHDIERETAKPFWRR